MKGNRNRTDVLLACAVLAGLVLFAFIGATDCGFVFDDGIYILDNLQVLSGLNSSTAGWAFRTFHTGNWHPLTWLSHATDVQLYLLNPIGHHLTSILLHVANAILLLLVLKALTGSLWRSALAAAVWAVHPLRLESVAWVAERKDVLAGFFGLLALLWYVGYARGPSLGRYTLVVIALVAGLMAKPMLVTLPVLLLLLDHWPLGREQAESGKGLIKRGRLIWEKVPIMFVAAAAGIVTMVAQRGAGNVADSLPLGQRAANAVVAYAVYLRKMVWPTDLAVYYPHPGPHIPEWQVAACAALLAGVTVLAIALRHRMPQVFVGWVWYLVTLIPVIGLVQVGDQAMADRYTYLPMIGLLIAVVWSLPELTGATRGAVAAVPALIVLVLLTAQTRHDIAYWRNDETLFRHALQTTEDNWAAEYGLARALGARKDYAGAEIHARRSLELNPGNLDARVALGVALLRQGKADAAVTELESVVTADPRNTLGRLDLSAALYNAGNTDRAKAELRRAVEAAPRQARFFIQRYRMRDELPPSPWTIH